MLYNEKGIIIYNEILPVFHCRLNFIKNQFHDSSIVHIMSSEQNKIFFATCRSTKRLSVNLGNNKSKIQFSNLYLDVEITHYNSVV